MDARVKPAHDEGWITLEQLEIFALLPFRDFGLVARDLGFLDAQIIIDETAAEPVGKAVVVAQRTQRLVEILRQRQRLRLVGSVRRWARLQHALYAVEP